MRCGGHAHSGAGVEAAGRQAGRRTRPSSPLPCLLGCPPAAAKEVEDRKAGLNKKQKLSDEAAAAPAAAAAGDAAAAPAAEAAAAPAGGEVEMKEADGSSSAAAQAQADPGAFAGQLTGARRAAGSLAGFGRRLLSLHCRRQPPPPVRRNPVAG